MSQFLVRLRLLAQALFSVLTHLLLQRPQLDQYFVSLIAGCRAHMHGERRLVQALERALKAQYGEILPANAFQGCAQKRSVCEERGELCTFKGAARQAQSSFQSGVGKHQAPIAAPQDRYQQ